ELLNDRLLPVDQLALSFDRLGLRCNRRLQLGDPLLISGDLRVVGGHDRIFATTPLTSCTPPKILSNRPSGQVRHLNTYPRVVPTSSVSMLAPMSAQLLMAPLQDQPMQSQHPAS